MAPGITEIGLARGLAQQGRTSRWHARAFGLDLEGAFPVPGLAPDGGVSTGRRRTSLELVPASVLEEVWRPAKAERIREELFPDGSSAMSLDRHDELGYRL